MANVDGKGSIILKIVIVLLVVAMVIVIILPGQIWQEEDVIRETMSCLDEARKSRGIIVGVSNYILPGTPEENLWAMIETMKEYR